MAEGNAKCEFSWKRRCFYAFMWNQFGLTHNLAASQIIRVKSMEIQFMISSSLFYEKFLENSLCIIFKIISQLKIHNQIQCRPSGKFWIISIFIFAIFRKEIWVVNLRLYQLCWSDNRHDESLDVQKITNLSQKRKKKCVQIINWEKTRNKSKLSSSCE